MTKKKVKKEVPVEENTALRYNKGKPELDYILDMGPDITALLYSSCLNTLEGDASLVVLSEIYKTILEKKSYDDTRKLCLRVLQGLYAYANVEDIFIEVSKVCMFGASKYERDNWKKGLSYANLLNSAGRHILKIQDGVYKDRESKVPHAGHVAWNLCVLLWFYQKECDKRNKK